MTIGNYLKDKAFQIILNFICAFSLILYLLAVGNTITTVTLIFISFWAVYFVILLTHYWKRNQYFKKLEHLRCQLDQPYLLQEFMEKSWLLEDQLYCNILRKTNEAALSRINTLQKEQAEYQSFLEGWIHEVKLPITGMRLACHNGKSVDVRRLELYLTEMDSIVEQALFYGRSENVYKDFQIAKTNLKETVHYVIAKNKYLFIENQMRIDVTFDDIFVLGDKKWLSFILTQIIANAVKYKKDNDSKLTFQVKESTAETQLYIRDNGIGIEQSELTRVFNKGFTGTNGRQREKSTGIGLYLCKKLCDKLDIKLTISSTIHDYTEICLTFAKNNYLSKL